MRFSNSFVASVVVALLAASSGMADTTEVFRFSFENASVGALTAPASETAAGVSATWTSPNNGIKAWGPPLGNVGVVRYFSDTTYQSILFTTPETLNINSLSFVYQGNTNFYPTYPSYTVSAVFDGLSLGTFTNSQSNVPFAVTLNGPGSVEAGSHEIKWIAPSFTGGVNSGTDYMALNDIVLTAEAGPATVPEIDPASFGSVLALVLGSLGILERRRLKAA